MVASKTGVTTKDPAWLTTGTRTGFQAPPSRRDASLADVEATDPWEAAISGDKFLGEIFLVTHQVIIVLVLVLLVCLLRTCLPLQNEYLGTRAEISNNIR